MIQSIKSLIDALRDELQNYGEMLALLDQQQEHLVARAVAEVFQSISLIKAQGGAIQRACARREDCRLALVGENNELLLRVRRRARQNHLMLRRSVELMQELLNTLLPSRRASVYDGTGAHPASLCAPRRFYDALG